MQNGLLNNLKNITKEHYQKLIFTFLLVLGENLLLLLYPIFAGFAINQILAHNTFLALTYAFVVLCFWVVGSARRAVDTRTFSKIYAQIAVNVIINEKNQNSNNSKIAARVKLSREFVDFFETHFPTLFTSTFSILGCCVMLLFIEPIVGIMASGILTVFALFLPKFVRQNDGLYFKLNNNLEKEVTHISSGKKSRLNRHYDLVSRLRIAISNREAISYLVIGFVMCILFCIAIIKLSLDSIDAGHIYAVTSYLWSFAMSLDDMPRLVEQYSQLKDIGKRVNSANQ